jgi:uncharacterized protein (TIGR03085 family)
VTTLARSERAALCDLALVVGEGEPTLCAGWTVKDLVVHLLVREGSPSATGIVVPALAGWTARTSRRVGDQPFKQLVERLRQGPPRLSPFSLPKADELLNSVEYFVHHEDIRRALPGWAPRTIDDVVQRQLWAALKKAGRGVARGVDVRLVAENSATGSTIVLKDGSESESVTVRGLPAEVLMYVFGRTEHAHVEVSGDVDRLRPDALGI